MAADAAATAVDTAASAGTLTGAPDQSTYGAKEGTSDTRQAQQTFSNDTPTDVNFNAVVARSQVLTVDVLGKSFEANNDRRAKYADHFMAILMERAKVA